MSYKKMIFTGTLILTLSGFLARILGFYNRIFLSNLIGAKELGIYQLIFPIYMLCFSLCCHGFETGISNLTSRFFAKGQKKNAHHLVRLGCFLSFCLSILLMLALFEGADYLSTFILKEASAAPSLKIAALSLPFVSIKACLHGYYIGLNHSSVPAVSQIVEQITRVGGIYLLSISVFIMGADARIAAWGMVLGEAVSTIYTILAYFRTLFFENSIFFQKNLQKNNSNKNKQNKKISNKKNQNKRILNKNNSDKISKNYNKKYADKRTFSRQADSFPLSTRELLEHFFSFSIPISVNHFCLTIISSLETMLIPFMLEIFFHSHSQALETYGTLTGMALPFLFFPATIVNSLSVMLACNFFGLRPKTTPADGKYNLCQPAFLPSYRHFQHLCLSYLRNGAWGDYFPQQRSRTVCLFIFRSMSIYVCCTDNFEYFKWIWKDETDSLP